MKQPIRALSLLLALLICLSMAIACAEQPADPGNTPGETPGSTPGDTPGSTPPTDNPEDVIDPTDYLLSLPARDFGKQEVFILCREDKEYEIDADENGTADLINDAVFERNARVEEYYNVLISSAPCAGSWDQKEEFIARIRNTVTTGGDEYDLIAGYLAYMAPLAVEELFHNLHDVPTLELEREWWSESFTENMTVYDRLYFADGDLSLTLWESLYAIYFNKQMAEDHGLPDLYEVVRDEDWTLSYLHELTEDIYEDNGNDEVDMYDTYGMVINCHSARALLTTCDVPIMQRNDDDTYDLVFYESERTVDFFLQVYDFIHENESVYMMVLTDDSDYTDIARMFMADQSLFISGTLDQSAALRNMETEFGILPFPKYDELQEEYLAHSYDGHSIWCIPSSLGDTSVSGAIMDALGAESKRSVVPQYYEVVLKGRTSRDEQSAEMLNIIRENLYFDFGFVYNIKLGSVFSQLGDMMERGEKIVASSFAAKHDACQKQLEELLDALAGS